MSFQTKRVRTKVYCYCKKCNGSLVDPRTKKRHISKRINYEEPRPSDEIDDIEMDFNEIDDNAMEYDPPVTERDYNFLTKKLPINESEKSQIIKKGKFSDRVLENLLLDADDNDKDSEDRDPDEDSKDDEENDDYEEINFASPDFHRLKAVQPAIMPVGVYWSIRTIDMLNKKQPAFIKNRT